MGLNEVIKSISKQYEMSGIARVGISNERFETTISLGSPGFDFCTYNSVPEGCFIEVSGKESSGKTLLGCMMARNYIKAEKDRKAKKDLENAEIIEKATAKGKSAPELQDYQIRHILFVDAEGTADPNWFYTATGYDMNDEIVKTVYLTPLGQTAEQIMDMVVDFVKTGEIGLVIFDSIVAIAPQIIADASMEKKDMGALAKVMADFVKKSTGLFNRYRATFIGINGIIMNIGGYGNPETTPGGEYWRRACSLRLRLKRGDYFDEDGNILKSSAESPAGHVIEMAVLKTKICRWDRKLGRCHLNYTKGVDLLQDTVEVATNFNIITNPKTGYYNILDVDTGEILVENIHGEKAVKKYFKEHVDLWAKVYDKVYEKLSVKDDPNIVSFENMLRVNVSEVFGVDLDKENQ